VTLVQVWLLNEGRWFRFWQTFEARAPRDDALKAVRAHVRLLLQGVKRRDGWSPSGIAYEVVREDG